MPSPFHPDLRGARFLPRAAFGPRLLPLVRRGSARAEKAPTTATVTDLGPGSTVRLHRPAGGDGTDRPALLWIHGGGMVMGNAAQDEAICRGFADALGIVVASVDYRLAPEHPYPAPLDDCAAALAWLVEQPGVDPGRVAVGGASAGGGLAAGLALRTRDEGAIGLAFQLLVYPMIDDRTARRPDPHARVRRMWSGRSNRFGWSSYLGADVATVADVAPYAAPARAEDLAGLPPAWIGVGSVDLFHDEDLAYADRLRAAGVEVEVLVVPGAYHGFDVVQRKAGVSRDFYRAQTEALRAALHPAG